MADALIVVARRDIAEGEELTLDYALCTVTSTWATHCHCKSPLCRTNLNDC